MELKFGNEETDYSITIKAPEEFSSINYLDIENYYISSSEQEV